MSPGSCPHTAVAKLATSKGTLATQRAFGPLLAGRANVTQRIFILYWCADAPHMAVYLRSPSASAPSAVTDPSALSACAASAFWGARIGLANQVV